MESNGPVSGKELALETGADHILLLRLLRYLVARHAVGEAGIDTYILNNVTNNFAVGIPIRLGGFSYRTCRLQLSKLCKVPGMEAVVHDSSLNSRL